MIIYEPRKRDTNYIHCNRELVSSFYIKYNLEQVGKNENIRVHNAKDSNTPSCR